MFLLLLALSLSQPEVAVELPDTVRSGEVFQVRLTVTGSDLSDIGFVPAYSSGLEHLGTGSMNSFSSVTTPSGTRVTSSTVFTVRLSARSPGTHTAGPFRITSSGTTIYTTEEFSLTAVGSGPSPGSASGGSTVGGAGGRTGEEVAWMEVDIDTTGRVYPGETFSVDYYIFKRVPSAEVVDLYLEPSDFASSELVDDIDRLQWVRDKNGYYRTWLATVEVTPVFACTLSLPVLRGRIGLPGGMLRPSREHLISTRGARIPVYPFPESGRPDNFTGIAGGISFSISRLSGCYSPAGETGVRISASGPGAAQLSSLPELTVDGPAEVLPGRSFDAGGDTRIWNVLVQPSDSGTVIIGPDSVAWFDTESESYRQAVIPACTLSVYPIARRPADLSFLNAGNGGSASFWLVLVLIILLSASLFLLLRHRRRSAATADVMAAGDIEELLTALGNRLSVLLTGSHSYMGSEELDEALDGTSLDVILARRVLRHWKDLELMLSGRRVTPEQLNQLKDRSMELIMEIETEMKGEEEPS